jgi:nitrite reductase/ring-hydroxylating ferredoxin subunit
MSVSLGPLAQFPVDEATRAKAGDITVVVVRQSADPDTVCVVLDKCPHAGLSLTKGPRGTYDDGVITCPWHNSKFDVCSGENLDWVPGVAGVKVPQWSRRLLALGKQPTGLQVLNARVSDGEVIVDIDTKG